jgi:hypothetical protein
MQKIADSAVIAARDKFGITGVLLPRISVFNSNLAQSMLQRLGLIVSGLDRDPETAKIDLGLITNDLLQIETALFSH